MKYKIFSFVIAFASIFFIFAWYSTAPPQKIKLGDFVRPLILTNIHGINIDIPNSHSKWIHLQFRRFAGCPICNLHLQSFVQRNSEIEALGIHEVVIFHSPNESLLPYQGKFPFDVVADPERNLYVEFGVSSSVFSLLDPRAWPAIIKGNRVKDRPTGKAEGGVLGLPADFLIAANGKIIADHYGRYADDQWTVDDLLDFIKSKELIK